MTAKGVALEEGNGGEMKLADARKHALSLPGTTEEPHFDMTSWRVNHKIFATIPPEGGRLHIFVDEGETRACVDQDPIAYEELWWGKKLVGVRVNLTKAKRTQVAELLEEAWRRRAPKRLLSLKEECGQHGAV